MARNVLFVAMGYLGFCRKQLYFSSTVEGTYGLRASFGESIVTEPVGGYGLGGVQITQRLSADESRPAGARMRIITSSGFRSGAAGRRSSTANSMCEWRGVSKPESFTHCRLAFVAIRTARPATSMRRPEATTDSVCNPQCVRSVGLSRRAGWLSGASMCRRHVGE